MNGGRIGEKKNIIKSKIVALFLQLCTKGFLVVYL